MNVIRRWITQPNALLRAAALFGAGMALTLAAACLSWPLLPEGLLKNANPLWNWAVSSRPLVGGLQIFGFNLIFACVLVGANLFARGPQGGPLIPCGYSCLLLLFLLYGLMVAPGPSKWAEKRPLSRPGCCACSISARPPAWWRCPPSAASPREQQTSLSSRPWGAGPPSDGCGISACPVRTGGSLLWASCSCSQPP